MANGEKRKILVVDDNAKIRKIIAFNFKARGYEVHEAANGKLAVNFLQKITPDAMILDVMMPEMDGNEVCSYIRGEENLKTIPIVMLTALSMPDDKIKSFDTGADVYIVKPFNITEVIAQVEALLRNVKVREDKSIETLKDVFQKKSEELNSLQTKLDIATKEVTENNKEDLGSFNIFDNMGKLTYSIIHEFKNVLTVILTKTYCIDLYTEEEKDRYMQTIIDLCNNCSKVIDSMLNLSNNAKDFERENISMADLIREMIFLFKGEFNLKGIKIEKKLDENTKTFINKYHIQQSLINILINAGEILEQSDKKEVLLKVYKDNEFVYASVKDTGCGIPEEYINKIFEPFFVIPRQESKEAEDSDENTKEKKETGLGLLLAKQLIETNDGLLTVESKVGQGAEFVIKLPLIKN